MWANDYPHAEGTWPHSAEAIEREMGHLNDEQREKILGMNAARMFKFDVEKLIARRQLTNRAAVRLIFAGQKSEAAIPLNPNYQAGSYD